MTGIDARVFRPLAIAAALLACGLPRVADLAAQEIIALVEQESGPMLVRMVGCGPACKVMRFDDLRGSNAMFIEVLDGQAGLNGRFSFVDHKAKRIDILNFSDPALADFVFGAQGAERDLIDAMMAALSGGGLRLQPTGERRTFAVRSFETGDSMELEAEQYEFEFGYLMEGLPGLAQMTSQQRAQLPDIKMRLTMSGDTWVVPGATGAEEVMKFFMAMGAALRQYTIALPGGNREQADMTAAMVSNMARLAALGLPVQTTTSTEMRPELGGSHSAMAQMMMRMMKIPNFPASTSRVVALGADASTAVTALGSSFAPLIEWGWRTGGPTNRQGYEVERGYRENQLVKP